MSKFSPPITPYAVNILDRAPALASFVADKLENLNMDALTGVIKAVPEWHILLDNLNSQISLRQCELAELDAQRPPTRSLKNKGSTESLLRPKNLDEAPVENGDTSAEYRSPTKPRIFVRDTACPTRPAVEQSPIANVAPPLIHHGSSPSPVVLQRRTSDHLNAPNFTAKPSSPTAFRKRKTESLTSAEGQTPKYRTRSMIIVYYDSQVQLAFEELVKYISASRNAMRKGKMAARMAEMRRLAEIETAEEELEDQQIAAEKAQNEQVNGNRHAISASKGGPEVDTDDNGYPVPKLRFVSTRKMGPSRGVLMMGQRGLKDGLKAGGETATPSSSVNIFDELDTGLEWCQSMCEHAAHQFLRDGDCSIEVSNIKRRLTEVKEAAEREVSKSGAEAMEKPKDDKAEATKSELSRTLKPLQMRRPIGAMKKLEVDEMDVDDEGYEDELPKLKWRTTRSRGPRLTRDHLS
jgi:hypothetical protein